MAARGGATICQRYLQAARSPLRDIRVARPTQPAWRARRPASQVLAPHLSESTRAKVSVLTSQAEAAEELRRHLGPDLVPADFGGGCRRPLDEFPAQRSMLDLAAALSGGGGGSGGNGSSGSSGSTC